MAESPALGRNLISATGFATAATACYAVFVLWQPGQQLDAAALGADLLSIDEQLRLQVFGALRAGSVVVLGVLMVALGVAALIRGKIGLVVATLVGSVAAAGGASLLRRVLWRPELGAASYEFNTWPSGHVAAVCVLCLACLRLMPEQTRWPRSLVLVAILVVTGAGYTSMTTFAHRPSDAVGGILLAAAVLALIRPRRRGRYPMDWEWAVVLMSAAGAAVLLIFPLLLAPEDPQATLAWGWLLAMLAAACAVLLPESRTTGKPHSSRS